MLNIAGYDEVNHLEEVLESAQRAGIRENIRYLGPVEDQAKWDLYHQADLLILPSFSENFGNVVAEALASSIPVITTTGTPWRDLKRYNCGWWVDPSVEGLSGALNQALATSKTELAEMGNRGRTLVEQKYSWKVVGEMSLRLYEEISSGQPVEDADSGL